MDIRRVALIFDNVVRPETTGGYCLRALRELVEVEFFLPVDIERIPKTGFDLYLNIDDGLRYHLPCDLHPCAWWVIDTHMDAEWAEDKGKHFDWLFAAQRDGAERLSKAGLPAHWLPLACDPAIHRPHPLPKRYDVCFVGRIVAGIRHELLQTVQHHFPNSFIGQRYFEDFAQAYSQSRVGFNRSVKNDVNMRVFETLGCGTLLITNDLRDNGQEELLQSDRHLLTYLGPEELVDKLRFYLGYDGPREKIAQAGQAEVIARHTYRHRMQSILETIERQPTRIGALPAVAPEARREMPPPADWLDSIDFLVKTFLRPQALLRLLRSILEFYPTAHVTIADDGDLRNSPDADSRACCELIDGNGRIVLHSMPFGAGVTPGRNVLVDRTRRPFLLILDDDFCFTAETKIERLWHRLQSDAAVGVVAGACIDVAPDGRHPRNSGGTFEIQGDTLLIETAAWRDRNAGLRDYVPQFALIRREVFETVRWEGGIGGEHYDFCLQLQKIAWKVAQDMTVVVDHYHFTPALPGYAERRHDCAAAQEWLLRKWHLARIVQDGRTIIERPASAHGDETLGGTNVECGVRRTAPTNGAATGMPGSQSAIPTLPSAKDAYYFDFQRPEVVALIPETARRVLDIGCGAGRLGEFLKQRQPAEVVGIERQPDAAARARRRLDQVIERSVEDDGLDFPSGRFDCVVCADVLEHLREPAPVLGKIRRWLTPEGVLVASLPNVRHHSVVASLLEGNWTYEAAGLLDSDHVRFFTRREIEKLLDRQGFEIQAIHAKPGPGYEEWHKAGRPGSVRIGSLNITGLAPEDAEEFFTYQFLVVARSKEMRSAECGVRNGRLNPADVPPPGFVRRQALDGSFVSGSVPTSIPHSGFRTPHSPGLTSIVIVTFNQLAYTKECVDSIRLRTDEPYELIFVDNGSTDGTPGYLRSLHGATLIENRDNRGFPAAVNQALRVARGEFVVLLNNDTVVTTGWLRRMHNVLERDPQIGLVGPCSNNVSGSQCVAVTYQDLSSLDGFAWEWGKRHDGVVEPTDRLIGFCLLICRKLLEQIGPLDEQFGIGCFEDDDLCLRALHAGWKVVIARAAFVHHYGSRTFQGSGLDLGALLQVNREKFQRKWSNHGPTTNGEAVEASKGQVTDADGLKRSEIQNPKPEIQNVTSAPIVSAPRFTLDRAPTGGLLLKPVPIKLSLCMIVRDNETTIGPCLESIRPYVDELVIVDTGSKDRTREICRNYGARIFQFPWCDDFSAARNESLNHARGEWLFWMDSDDTIPAECGRKLRQLADGSHAATVLGYIVQVHCPGSHSDGCTDVTVVDHAKLIRNRAEIRFEGRIHEQLLPAIRRARGEVAWTDIYVVHSGSDHSPAGKERKLERDLRILNRELGEKPDHPFVLFNLGMTYADVQRNDEAISYLRRCIAVSKPEESHLRKAYGLLVSSLGQAERHDEAWKVCQEGLSFYPDDKELLFRCAMLHHHFGRLDEAERTYLRVLNEQVERHFTSIDQCLAGYKARHNLAVVYGDMGLLDKAEAEWRRIVAEMPCYCPGWRGLGENLVRQGKMAEAEQLCQQLIPLNGLLHRESHILQARLAEIRGDVAEAVRELSFADHSVPDDLEPLRTICRILYEGEQLEAAKAALQELIRRAPEEAAAYHNLGTLCSRQGAMDDAIRCYRRSLELRPNAPHTERQLRQAIEQSRQLTS